MSDKPKYWGHEARGASKGLVATSRPEGTCVRCWVFAKNAVKLGSDGECPECNADGDDHVGRKECS